MGPTDVPKMLISVIIPHLNQPESLQRCLAALAQGRRQADEVIVVDNGSVRLPQSICDAMPGVRLMQQSEPGPGPARNAGIAAATGTILAFIDADCIADPDWLACAERTMSDPALSILGGDVQIARATSGRLTMLEAYEGIYAYRMDRYIAREGFTGTGNLVVRQSVLRHVGQFAGIGTAEDRDWGQRATALGYRIRYVPQMVVFHPARTDFVELCRKWDRHLAHDFLLAQQSRLGRAKWVLKMLAMAASPLFELPRIATSDRVRGLRARGLAFVCLTRIRLYRAGGMTMLLLRNDAAALAGRWNRPAN